MEQLIKYFELMDVCEKLDLNFSFNLEERLIIIDKHSFSNLEDANTYITIYNKAVDDAKQDIKNKLRDITKTEEFGVSGKNVYHAGCLRCERIVNNKDRYKYCAKCRYFGYNWDLPDMSGVDYDDNFVLNDPRR